MVAVSRRRTRQQIADAKKHLEYITKYREDPDYVKNEYKQRILRRVAKGAIPHVGSMEKYDITLEDINNLRKQYDYEPIVMNIPMFLQSRLYRGREGIAEVDFVPDVSEVVDEYRPGERDEEVEQPAPPETLAETQTRVQSNYTGKLDAMSISIWMRNNPRQATTKQAGKVSQATTNNQYGSPNSDKTGYFYNFMKYLGDEYVKDVSLVLRRRGVEHIRDMVNKPRKNIRNDDFKTLKATNGELSTLLIALRNYPAFTDDYLNDERFKDAYDGINRIWRENEAKISAEALQNPKKDKPVVDWETLKGMVKKKYPDPLSKEHLYIDMYDEFPSRDNMAELFVDATNKQVPSNSAQIKSIKKNTLFIPNKSTRKRMKKAVFVLVDYKTRALYGTKEFEFSEALTNRIVKYREANKSGMYLFGKTKMTGWVGQLLDSIGIKQRTGLGNISYLRKSYISTALQTIKTSHERTQLAFKLEHSPSASLKYIRELQDIDQLDEEAVELARSGKLTSRKLD